MVDAALVLEAADAHVVLAGVTFGLQVAQFAHVVSQVCTDGGDVIFAVVVLSNKCLQFFPVIDAWDVPTIGADALMLFLDLITGKFFVVFFIQLILVRGLSVSMYTICCRIARYRLLPKGILLPSVYRTCALGWAFFGP